MQVLRRILGLQSAEDDTLPKPTTPMKPAASGAPAAKKPLPVDGATTPLNLGGRTRQLEPLDGDAGGSTEHSGRLIVGQRTDVGQVRDNNQDAMSAFTATISSAEDKPDFGLFIVADGMGGHEDGEKASGLAARIVGKHIMTDVLMPLLADSGKSSSDQQPLADVVKTAIQKANDYISTHVPDGGTTITAVTIVGRMACIAHVGDSRAYLIQKDGIEQLTRDHSLVQRLIELGQLTPEEAAEHPQRNVLYRAIGQNDSLDVDAITRQLPAGSYVLICSDGLWNLITSDELLAIVLNHGSNTQLACQTLVDLANERGGSDNITVILVRVPE